MFINQYIYIIINGYIYIMVSGIPTPLKNMISSVGMMTFPMKSHNIKHFPNHQPVIHVYVFILPSSCHYLTTNYPMTSQVISH